MIKALTVFFVILTATAGFAADFETDSWPGEGVPHFSVRNDALILHSQPEMDSKQLTLKLRKGTKIIYDKSKQITKKSVMLTAKTEVTELWCKDAKGSKDSKPVIKPGDTIEYLQYGAEGYITARYAGNICDVFVMDNVPKFDGLEKEPVVEWWVRVVDKNTTPQGWLLVDKSQVNFLKRSF